MEILKCKMCGADLDSSDGSNIYKCQYCGTKHTVDDFDNKKEMIFIRADNTEKNTSALLKRAEIFLNDRDFKKADEYFEKVLEHDLENEKALLGKILVKYKVLNLKELTAGTQPINHENEYKILSAIASDNMKLKLEEVSAQIQKNLIDNMKSNIETRDFYIVGGLYKKYIKHYDLNEDVLLCKLFADLCVSSIQEIREKGVSLTNSNVYYKIVEYCSDERKEELIKIQDEIIAFQNELEEKQIKSAKKAFAVIISLIALVIIGAVIYNIIVSNPANIYSYVIENNEVTIIGMKNPDKAIINGKIKFPSEIKDMPVTKIGSFAINTKKEFILKIESVVIPESVLIIDSHAFMGCKYLENIEILSNNPKLGEYTFNGCQIKHADVPAVCIQYIPTQYLETIIINGGDKISQKAFEKFKKLTTVNITKINQIEEAAFRGCTSLVSVVIPEDITEIGAEMFYDCKKLKNVKLHNNITKIGAYAFANCERLEYLTLPNELKEIEYNAFYNCNQLKKIIIPKGVETIGAYAFTGCEYLEIYCRKKDQPVGWDEEWNDWNCTVVWNYAGN